MYIPKRYGQSRVDSCPFCDKRATTENSQGIPVCASHKNAILNELKCACGSYLETRTGKFGTYFYCMKCGNVSMKKAMEMNEVKDARQEAANYANPAETLPNNENKESQKATKTEKIITTDDPEYFS